MQLDALMTDLHVLEAESQQLKDDCPKQAIVLGNEGELSQT